MRAGASEAKIAEVTTALTSDLFDESEKTALEYAEAITFTDRKVTEELFARVRAHFSEAQIVELTAIGLEPIGRGTWEEAAPGDVERDLGQCPGGRCVTVIERLEGALHAGHGGLEIDPDALRQREHDLLATDDGLRSYGRP